MINGTCLIRSAVQEGVATQLHNVPLALFYGGDDDHLSLLVSR